MRCELPQSKPVIEDTYYAAILLLQRYWGDLFFPEDCLTIDTLGTAIAFGPDCCDNFFAFWFIHASANYGHLEQFFGFETAQCHFAVKVMNQTPNYD